MALIYDVAFDSQTRILSLLDKAGNVISSCEVPSKSNELKLTATADKSSVKLIKNGTLSNTYEVNVGSGWTAYTFGTVINLNSRQSCKWRCSAHPTTQSGSNYVQFVMSGAIKASGNANSMLSSDFENITSLSGYDYAFVSMFEGCKSLTQAPELPATTLSENCYRSMFYDCASLTQAPALPATTIAPYCYWDMFRGCIALTKAPELPASTIYFSSYRGMFYGCTSLTQAPALPATTISVSCYRDMFRGCTALTKAPELPASTLVELCYEGMFCNCSSLAEVRIAATTASDHTNPFHNWLSGVSATGDFYCDPSATIFPSGASGIPTGWVRLNINDYPNP